MIRPLALVVLVSLALLSWPRLWERFRLNVAARTALVALADHRRLPMADQALADLSSTSCHANWLRGFVAQAIDREGDRDAAWATAIRCDPGFIPMLRSVLPDHQVFAELAVRERPDSAEAWFWLAQLRQRDAPAQAIALYQEGLRLDPGAGLRWRQLGDLLVRDDPLAATSAYLQSCLNGDPGYNGCDLAGQTAERLGDPSAAIQYYRLSLLPAVRDRAAQLEQQSHR